MSETCVQLVRGANATVPTGATRVLGVAAWRPAPGVDVDVSALMLSGGRVRTDADFIFYNQQDGAGVHYLGGAAARPVLTAAGLGGLDGDGVRVDLAQLPSAVDAVVLAASLDPGGSAPGFGAVTGLHLLLFDDVAGHLIARYDLREAATETALLFGELYRRGRRWRLRAVGQGYDSGLAGLAVDFGVTIDDEPVPAPGTAGPGMISAPTPGAATTPAAPLAGSAPIDWAHPPVPTGYELPGEGGF